jgi:hypothetical protein
MFKSMNENNFAMIFNRSLVSNDFSVFNPETWKYEFNTVGKFLDNFLKTVDKEAQKNFEYLVISRLGSIENMEERRTALSRKMAAFFITNKRREILNIIEMYNLLLPYSDYDENMSERSLYETFKFLYQEIIQ